MANRTVELLTLSGVLVVFCSLSGNTHAQSGDRESSEVRITLGEDQYMFKVSGCSNEAGYYSVRGYAGEEKDAARFSFTRYGPIGPTTNAKLEFSVDDIWIALEPAPWQHDGEAFVFEGDVTVNTIGPDPKPVTMFMSVYAPC